MKASGFFLLVPAVSALKYCPPPGAVLPAPIIQTSPETLIDECEFQDLPFNKDSSYIIKANVGDTEVFTYSWISPTQHLPDKEADPANIKSRVASVTKLFTVLAVLLSHDRIKWDASIRQYVTELRGDIWEDVKISALAGHTAGLGKFASVGDLSAMPNFAAGILGIPHVNGSRPSCDLFPGGRQCTREESIAMFNSPQDLPRSPNSGPLYGNIGLNLLGVALENVYGVTYEEVIQQFIIDPLDLKDTSFEVPNKTENAFFPGPGENWLLGSYGNFNPTGGLWSTPKDIMTFMRAILDNKLLSAAENRKWLQGLSTTSSLHQLVGAPWELYRPDNLETTPKRPIDVYTKAGGVEGYGAYGVIVPEYDLAISILAAGNSSNVAAKALLQTVTTKLIPWADEMARTEARTKYAGTYSSGNGTSVTVSLDEGPGLALTDWTMNGVNVLASLSQMVGRGGDISARAYPTDPDSLETNKQFWRIHVNVAEPESEWADMDCSSWTQMDKLRYIREPLDAAYFVMEGDAKAIEFPGWRMQLQKRAQD